MKVLTTLDVMRVMQVDDARAVREWFRSGRLKGVNLGGRLGWRCTEEQLQAFLNQQTPTKQNEEETGQ